MLGVNRLMEDLRALGHTVEGPFQSGGIQWLIVNEHNILTGRLAGQVVRVAVPVQPDYPATPPGGLYISPRLVPPADMGRLSIHDRSNETAGLGGEWEYWSRPIPPGTWKPENGARRLVVHWNSVMRDAN